MVARQKVSVFGATGSIGASTVDLLLRHIDRFDVEVVSANDSVEELAQIAKSLGAKLAVTADAEAYADLKAALQGSGIESAGGETALLDSCARTVDWSMMAICGAAALKPSFIAAANSKRLALANKESIICAGPLLLDAVKRSGCKILPADSEHNAIFQILDGRDQKDLSKVTLTASGGPFRDLTLEQMQDVSVEDALAHPIWKMGSKISIDSATLMNKGLELIEAQLLFNLQPNQLDVVIHPQSVIHALVSFNDSSVLAQMANPDMRVAIASCLGWPQRLQSGIAPLNLAEIGQLTFEAPDEQRFPALRLARETMEQGGLAPCILSAANEIAVGAFLQGHIKFTAIPEVIAATLEASASMAKTATSLDDVLEADADARRLAASVLPHYAAEYENRKTA